MDGRLAIIGTGRLGEVLLRGLLRSGTLRPEQVTCTARRAERADELVAAYGVEVTLDNRDAISRADTIVLAVKPQVLPPLLDEVADAFRAGQLVVSLAAGVRTTTIEERLPDGVAVVRVMTNTAALVDEAMSVVSSGAHAGEDDVAAAESLVAPMGRVVRVGEEHLDAVTAVSGSGPAYVFLVAEAMTDAGVQLGLDREVASELVTQTVLGAGRMLRASGLDAVGLREMVTSPGGTTQAALTVLEDAGLRAALVEALAAARRRGEELAGPAEGSDRARG